MLRRCAMRPVRLGFTHRSMCREVVGRGPSPKVFPAERRASYAGDLTIRRSTTRQIHSSPGSSDRRIGWPVRCACRLVCLSSTSRMQPIWPTLVRIRRCTQALVVVRYSADQGRCRVGPRGSRRGGGRQRRDHSRAETRSGCSRRGSSRAGFERRQVVVAPLLAPFGIARGGGPITGRTAPSRARVDRPRPGKFQIVDAAGPPSDAALAKELSLAAGAGSGNGDGASFAVRLEAPFFDARWSPC